MIFKNVAVNQYWLLNLPPEIIENIFTHLNELEQIDLALSYKKMAKIFSENLKEFKFCRYSSLESILDKTTNESLSEQLFNNFMTQNSKPLGTGKSCLLGKGESPKNLYNKTYKNLKAVLKNYPKITSVCLNGYNNITDEGLGVVAESCTNLISLDLSFCNEITSTGLKAIAESFPNLASLNLSNCYNISDEGLQAVAQHCTDITHLDLKSCRNITDEGLDHLKSLTNLTDLDFDCENITAAGLAQLRTALPHCDIIR